MTGLDRERDTVMSIACFITDADLKLKDHEGFEVVVHHDTAAMDSMDDWCKRTHGKSGLSKACMESVYSAENAASMLLDYIKRYVPEPRTGLLAGNSVHCDKEFLSKGPYKHVLSHLHYRILDVSSIKEAARRWAPEPALKMVPGKKGLHQAREDILESIEEARYYQTAFFRKDEFGK
jgi:oligoribonuclease